MIISCIKCNKKFAVEDNLIPEQGRVLQCGACTHTWHYIPILLIDKVIDKKKTEDNIKNNEPIINIDKNEKKINLNQKKIFSDLENYNIEINPDLENNNKNSEIQNKKIITSFLSKLLVSIISLVALIIILDTFKYKLIGIFPNLEFYLSSLYNTITDIFLFITNLTK